MIDSLQPSSTIPMEISSQTSIYSEGQQNTFLGKINQEFKESQNQHEEMQQIQNLGQKLYYRNCCLSLVCIGSLIVCFIISNYMAGLIYLNYLQRIKNPSLYDGIKNQIYQQYKELFQYPILVSDLVKTSLDIQPYLIDSYNQSQAQYIVSRYKQSYKQKIYQLQGQIQCLSTNQTSCQKLQILQNLLWQFSQNPFLKNSIEESFICLNTTQENIANRQNIECLVFPFLNSSKNFFKNSLFQFLQQKYDDYHGQKLSVYKVNGNENRFIKREQSQEQFVFTVVINAKFTLRNIVNINKLSQLLNQQQYVQIWIKMENFENQQIFEQYQLIKNPLMPNKDTEIEQFKIQYEQNLTQKVIQSYSIKIGVTHYTLIQSMQFTFGTYFIVCLFVFYVLFFEIKTIRNSIFEIFYRKQILNKMYKRCIKQIFVGKKPTPSFVLKKGPLGQFFYQLSQLINKQMASISLQKPVKLKRTAFKFKNITKNIIDKYKALISHVMQVKNKQILNNRFSIQSYINAVCQNQAIQLKQYFVKASQANILNQFFKLGYMAILRNPQKFNKFIKQDRSPIPKQLIEYFRSMNTKIHQVGLLRKQIQSQVFHVNHQQVSIQQKKTKLENLSEQIVDANSQQKYQRRKMVKNYIRQISSCESNELSVVPKNVQILKKKKQSASKSKNKHKGAKVLSSIRDKIESDQSVGQVVFFQKTQTKLSNSSNYQTVYKKSSNLKSNFDHTNSSHQKQNMSSAVQDSQYQQQLNWETNQTEQQIQIRIRVLMIPKYINMFKDLDFEYQYASNLGLRKQIINISQIIDNTRYLLTRHNKNIRIFSKHI